jgi:predicted MPP superfamily phosphohydrolase
VKTFLVLVLILAAANLYVAGRVRVRVGPVGWASLAVALPFLLFFVLQLIAPLAVFRLTGWSLPVDVFWIRASYVALGLLACMVFMTALTDSIGLVATLTGRGERRWLDLALLILLTAGTGGCFIAGVVGAGKVRLVETTIEMDRLPPAFDGLRIAQISDLHIGSFLGRAFVQRVADLVASARPDIVVMTGDAADGFAAEREEDLAPLAKLKPRFGKYAVTGNHEYYWDARGWIGAYGRLGFQTLINDAVLVERGNATLAIAGVPDPAALTISATPPPDPEWALSRAAEGDFRILLAHQPRDFPKMAQLGFDLQLSGHTHGGQFFPFSLLVRAFQPYFKGVYSDGPARLYVSPGAGYWGPPLRTGGGEVTLLILRRPGQNE